MEETIPKAFIFKIWSVEIYSWTSKFLENIKANNKKIYQTTNTKIYLNAV